MKNRDVVQLLPAMFCYFLAVRGVADALHGATAGDWAKNVFLMALAAALVYAYQKSVANDPDEITKLLAENARLRAQLAAVPDVICGHSSSQG